MLLDGESPEDKIAEAAADPVEPERQELPPPPEPDKPVALPERQRRTSRRDEAQQAALAEVTSRLEKMNESMAARDRQIGELTGHISALSQRPQYQPQQQYQPPPPQLPDPEELERKALERLDARDMTGYQRLSREAGVAATLRSLQPILARQQQQQAPQPQQEQVPPGLMPFFAAYPDVASHPKMMTLLAAENVRLEGHGFPAGPERVRKIFENVRADLTAGKKPGQQGFSAQSAQVLSGVPTQRPANGGQARDGQPRVDLTSEERIMAKRAGFSEAEIAETIAQAHPERILRG